MTLHRAGHKRNEISSMLSLSYRQVSYIVNKGTLAPVPMPKRKRKLTQAQVDELEAFVRLSRENRQMSYLELVYEFRFRKAGVYAITSALKDRGYYRHLSLEKPPLSEANKRKRFEWVSERLHWTYNDWCRILWSDETWVTDGRHRDAYVTRKVRFTLATSQYSCFNLLIMFLRPEMSWRTPASWTKVGKELLGCSGGASLEDKKDLVCSGKSAGGQ